MAGGPEACHDFRQHIGGRSWLRRTTGNTKTICDVTPVNEKLSADFSAESSYTPPGTRTPDPLIKSRKPTPADHAAETSGQPQTERAPQCTEAHETPASVGSAEHATADQNVAGMRTDDSDRSTGGPRANRPNDKLDNKQNDKKTLTDPALARVVDAWAGLPEAIKTTILTIVRSATCADE